MTKALLKSKVWRRLEVALRVQQKFLHENRDKALIDKANKRVAQLVKILEAMNELDDTAVICE